jgi:transposase
MSIDPSTAAQRVTAGVDWAKDDHAVCVTGDQGEVLERFAVRHDAAGLREMGARLLRAGALRVGIERGDGPVVETLLGAGLAVFVIPPGQVKNLRSRYGSAGNKDDRFDAYVLADVVRTDARRLRPLERDSEQTTALRSRTSPSTGSPPPTSCGPTCRPCSRAPRRCSPTSTRRSPWRS